ncbi:MAG: TonB-dependent receptor [Flavobacteriales bacterium]|nr:TonB-dependent receptor [Flavobacteriales bacterium]
MRALWSLLLLHLLLPLAAQQDGVVYGTVRDPDGRPVQEANIAVEGSKRGTTSGPDGAFRLTIPAGREVLIRFSHASFETVMVPVTVTPGEERSILMAFSLRTIREFEVKGERVLRTGDGLERLDPKVSRFAPSLRSGSVEDLLVGQPVVMRNELSSGYNVRGGNFDENLVYVNDIEVYRPFLVRAGQQEGLSFPNPDLIERISFSAGGWESRFGDKMSSVLDIHYKRPKEFAGSASLSLLGGSFHVESPVVSGRLRQVTGFRYRTLQSVLASTDVKGEYDPRYTDLQTYWTYDLSDRVELGFLGVYSHNIYSLRPQSRETDWGSFNQALRLSVYYEGEERTEYRTAFGAFNVNVKPNRDLLMKFTLSAFGTQETERFTVLGEYRLQELERDLGSDNFGEAVRDLGVGGYLEHARNALDATVYTFTHRGFLQRPRSYFQWGGDIRSEVINDKLNEWYTLDSAGYSIPRSQGDDLELAYSLKSRLNMESTRIAAYVQDTWTWNTTDGASWQLNAGVRAQHWTWNGQTVVSPRARLSYRPNWQRISAEGDTVNADWSFWFATGLYYQPPFYREVRDLRGNLNPDVQAQQSIHFLLGMDRVYRIWDRPFKFSAEAYYKVLNDLNPYKLSNVRIRYFADNNASGFATGLDLKLNGEFVKGIESWVGLGVLSTFEDLKDDDYYDRFNANGQLIVPGYTFDQVAVDSVLRSPGYIPRPTDQRVNFSLFFQDEMPRWPTFKVHLNMFFSTGFPYGPPSYDRYKDTLRTNIYRRVDIGFSKQLLGAPGQEKKGFLGHIRDMWVSVEVFNLLNIDNTINYRWIQDVRGRYYAVPEFLTPRRLNLKVIAWF